MAIYSDNADLPANLIYAQEFRNTVTPADVAAQLKEMTVVGGPSLTSGKYWIAIRAAPQITVAYSGSSPTTRFCFRNVSITNLDTAWPAAFGTATCQVTGTFNLYMQTYR